MTTCLHVVHDAAEACGKYDDDNSRRVIYLIREELMAASVRYIRDGKEGTLQDRLREASDMSGIPRLMLEAEIRRA